MSVYQLTPREIYQTYIEDSTDPATVLSTSRVELASRLRMEEELAEEDAYFATDQMILLAYLTGGKNRQKSESAQAGASSAKAEIRVCARVWFWSQSATRKQLSAAAVARCWREVLASPMKRERRKPKARTPWEMVPSMPARRR